MKFTHRHSRLLRIVIATLLICSLLQSCEKKLEMIPNSAVQTLPSLTVRDFKTIYTDSGKVQLILTSPVMEQYDNRDEPYSEFSSGILVNFYEGIDKPIGMVTANYARFLKDKNLWELRDSVVVINQDSDKLETELLFWDQQKDLIWSDRFVKITNEDQIVLGTGFESDSKLNRRRIRKVSATIYSE